MSKRFESMFGNARHFVLVGFALAALGAGGCATSPPSGVTPITGFDAERYLGTWYEIARLDHRFERGLTNVRADYSWREDGAIRVLNRGYNPDTGEWEIAEGKAKFRESPEVGSLKVSFFGPFYGGYHIVELGPDYQHALIAGQSRNYLWILARERELPDDVLNRLVDRARQLGFPTDELIYVEHDPTVPEPVE